MYFDKQKEGFNINPSFLFPLFFMVLKNNLSIFSNQYFKTNIILKNYLFVILL